MVSGFSGKKVLVVDDEARMVEFIAMNLELEGFRVIRAANGSEALEKASKEHPDLVLLDIMMPEMDGYEVARNFVLILPQVAFLLLCLLLKPKWMIKSRDSKLGQMITLRSLRNHENFSHM
jgi:DNA-binding response OmpR family regulator